MKPERDKGSVWLCWTLKFALFYYFFISKHAISSANAILSNTRTPRHESDRFFIYSVVLYE